MILIRKYTNMHILNCDRSEQPMADPKTLAEFWAQKNNNKAKKTVLKASVEKRLWKIAIIFLNWMISFLIYKYIMEDS